MSYEKGTSEGIGWGMGQIGRYFAEVAAQRNGSDKLARSWQELVNGNYSGGNSGGPAPGSYFPSVFGSSSKSPPAAPAPGPAFQWAFPQYSQTWAFTPPAPTPYNLPPKFDPKSPTGYYTPPKPKASKSKTQTLAAFQAKYL